MKINYLTFLAVAVVGLVIGGTTPTMAAVVVANNSFEADTGVSLGVGANYYVGRTTSEITSVPGWDFFTNDGTYRYNGLATQGSTLLENSGGLQSWSPYPDGNNAAFVLGGGSFSQTLSGFETGESYVVSFYAASRAPYAEMYQSVIVKMGDQTLLFGAASSITPEANAWTLYSSDAFTAAASAYTLSFTGVYLSDRTAFIDVVNVAQIPEPATMSLLGLSGLMLVLRKRKSSKV